MSIYPKTAANQTSSIKQNSCFILMPFSREMRAVHAAIKDLCKVIGMQCERADDIYSQRPIFSTVLDSILQAEIIIADLTGKNPNVFYETGIAHSFREPQSVILMAQSLEDVPFDLRHLPVILYRLENIQKLEIELENRISKCREATSGVNFASNYLFPLNFQTHDIKSFIDYANDISTNFFLYLAKCLSDKSYYDNDGISEPEIEEIFKTFRLISEANNGRWKRICDHLKLEILTSENLFNTMKEKCISHLRETKISQIEIIDRDNDFFASELCFKLIDRDLAKTEAINWLLTYLHNPKMGNIDVVRYKIETYIVDSQDTNLDASLLALLSSETASIRENAADMIGQKKITNSGERLQNALELEENPYAARSIITALARQNETRAVSAVVDWIKRHNDQWWQEPISITLQKVSLQMVRKLAPQSSYMGELDYLLSSNISEKRE